MLNKGKIVQTLNTTVSGITGRRPKEGMLFGLELEVEGQGVEMEGVPSKNWKRVHDGSLRGESIEFVSVQPVDVKTVTGQVNALFKAMKKEGVQLKNSYRTSTHVHLNFSDKTVKQMVCFFLLHTIFEEIFEMYCGEQRKGNLFCMSARDNENLVEMLEEAVCKVGHFAMFDDHIRYCAANLASLNKFGSIEVRTMRGADSAEQVNEWVGILNELYEYSCDRCPSPASLAESLSHLGPNLFMEQFFSRDSVKKLLASWPAAMDIRMSLLNGVRLIQMFSYKLEDYWNEQYEAPKPVKKVARADGMYAVDVRGVGQWFVADPHAVRNGQNDGRVEYDAAAGCYFEVDTGRYVRFTLWNGARLNIGSRLDLDVNRFYYAQNDEGRDFEMEDDDDE